MLEDTQYFIWFCGFPQVFLFMNISTQVRGFSLDICVFVEILISITREAFDRIDTEVLQRARMFSLFIINLRFPH